MTLCACSSVNSNVPTDSFCLLSKPMTWSDKDTPETQHQIFLYDAKGQKLCGW
jgi:hypothetical protein